MGLSNNELLEAIMDCIDCDIWDCEKLNSMSLEYLRGKIDGILYTLEMCNLTSLADKLDKWISNRIAFGESD